MHRWWSETKRFVLDTIGLSNDLAHVHFGLAAFLVIFVLLRGHRYGGWIAFGCVAVLQLANEIFDAVDWIRWTGAVHWRDAVSDTALTLFWPLVLVLVLRFGRGSLNPAGGKDG